MAMDMPPRQVVEYRVERAAPSPLAGMVAKAAAERPSIPAMMPKLDLSSTALGTAERGDLLAATQANQGGMAQARQPATDGYVSKRIRAAIAVSKANDETLVSGRPTAAQARDVKCLLTAAAMDPAAARYVQGGERSAAAARAAVPAAWVAECRDAPRTMRSVAARVPVSVTPDASRSADRPEARGVAPKGVSGQMAQVTRRPQEAQPRSIAPTSLRVAPVRIDPEFGRRAPQRLDLVSHSPAPRGITPTGSRKVPVSLGKGPDHGGPSLADMSAARSRGDGRG